MATKKEKKVVTGESEVIQDQTVAVEPQEEDSEETVVEPAEAEEPQKPAKKTAAKPAHEKKIVLTPKKYQHGKKYRAVENEREV